MFFVALVYNCSHTQTALLCQDAADSHYNSMLLCKSIAMCHIKQFAIFFYMHAYNYLVWSCLLQLSIDY